MSRFNTSSSAGRRQPYMRGSFWANPSTHFWKTNGISYTKETLERFQRLVDEGEFHLRNEESKDRDIRGHQNQNA